MRKFTSFNKYNKHQAILTSGRLILNAREDDLFILAKKDLSISVGGDVHINVGPKGNKSAKLIINSPSVQLGIGKGVESVAKGDSLVKSLESMVDKMSSFLSALSTANGLVSGGVASLPIINEAAKKLNLELSKLKVELKNIPSKTTTTT
jgi:hypothetical protein